MSSTILVNRLCLRVSAFLALPLALGLCLTSLACGDDNPVVRVEEDWELVLATPDVNSNGPQVVTAISPFGNLNALYVTFEMNHRSAPDSAEGGLHLQVWRGEEHLATHDYPECDELATTGEVVRWTQAVELQSGQIIFEIIHGQSTTWGPFGTQGNLKASLACDLTSLASYTPEVSTKNSGVTFAGHCVRTLKLTSVRQSGRMEPSHR